MVDDIASGEQTTPNEPFDSGFASGPAAGPRRRHGFADGREFAQKRNLVCLSCGAFDAGEKLREVSSAGARQRIFAVVPQFDFGRQHRAKRLTNRREIVAADPFTQLDEFRRQRRARVHQLGNFPDVNVDASVRRAFRRPIRSATAMPTMARLRNGTTTRRPTIGSPFSEAGTA